MEKLEVIPPRSGVAFVLRKDQVLKVVDIQGEQVADLICYNFYDRSEYLSSGRTIDYAGCIFFTKGHRFFSNRSRVMFEMTEDTVKRHDFLLSPCSEDTFRILYGHDKPHHGCFGNLSAALKAYDIRPDSIPTTFNIFMHVTIDGESGDLRVQPPLSKAGDFIELRAAMDLVVGLTACSAEMSNNYSFKPIGYHVRGPGL